MIALDTNIPLASQHQSRRGAVVLENSSLTPLTIRKFESDPINHINHIGWIKRSDTHRSFMFAIVGYRYAPPNLRV